MAWANTAYVTAADYRDKNGRVSTDFDTSLNSLAIAVSRIYDRRMSVAPGEWAPQSALTFTIRSTGGSLLYLRDERGWQHFLRTATAIGIDSEDDGTYDGYSLVLGTTARLNGYPMNSATHGDPYTALELRTGATPATWPEDVDVRITGDCGYASVPLAVVQRCSNIMRELVQVGFGGPQVDIEAVAKEVDTNRATVAILESGYRQGIPAF